MPEPQPKMFIVSPCRDEAQYVRRTLDSMVAQTLRPALWLIVDDGSSDATPDIVAEYAARHDWIRLLRRQDRGKRLVGPGVIDAFYEGYNSVDVSQFDYVCKMDTDLDLPAGYFQEVVRRIEADPRIGTASGKPYFEQHGKLVSEMCGDENSVGMIKLYRRRCFEDVGGFVRQVMWDGIDGHRCRMLGWRAVSWDDPEIRFLHLRPMGTSHKGWWTGRTRHGFGQWFMGTGPVYMAASALFRMSRPPIVLGGLGMWWGYVRSWLGRKARYPDLEFRRFLRRYQRACLLRGKERATAELDERQAAVWQARYGGASPAATPAGQDR